MTDVILIKRMTRPKYLTSRRSTHVLVGRPLRVSARVRFLSKGSFDVKALRQPVLESRQRRLILLFRCSVALYAKLRAVFPHSQVRNLQFFAEVGRLASPTSIESRVTYSSDHRVARNPCQDSAVFVVRANCCRGPGRSGNRGFDPSYLQVVPCLGFTKHHPSARLREGTDCLS